MDSVEKRIEFINLEFSHGILRCLQSGGFTAEREDQFIISMSWPWRAPDKSDFNSAYAISATEVVYEENQLVRDRKIGIPFPKQLRMRTIAQGKSIIRFSLIYADISNQDSLVAKILTGVGEAIIGKLTLGMSSILKAGVETAAQYSLERMVESASGEEHPQHILGRASLEFDGQNFSSLDLEDPRGGPTIPQENPISLKTHSGSEIVKLWIKIM